MTHKEIQSLLLRYREGKCTDEESAKIHQWYSGLNNESQLTLDDQERALLEDRLLRNIQAEIQGTSDSSIPVLRRWWQSTAFYSAAAASVILGLSFLFFSQKSSVKGAVTYEPDLIHEKASQITEIENETRLTKRIVMEDKSVIVLSPGSRLRYPQHFTGHQREVQLIGDAFFEITKNPARPFCVYSGSLVTRVLGTSFRIKNRTEDHLTEVEVVTGKVSVFENREAFANGALRENDTKASNGVVLTPNQRATYYSESRHLVTSLVENPVVIAAAAGTEKLVFNNTILPDIMAGLQQEYGIEIVLANEEIEKCTFTGDLSDLTLYDKLDLICKSSAAAYEVKGTRILITGAGCDDDVLKNH
jgi:transmembrane sensor